MLELDTDNFENEVLKAKRPCVVDFWAPWCGPCQIMGLRFESVSKAFEGKVKFAKINVDQNKDVASQNNIQGIPCIILFHDGKEVGRVVGALDEDLLKEKIESHLADINY